jgi:diadenosine tetraphosphate (Ap4A) HIT family hydrolase
VPEWLDDPVGFALRGENPTVFARLRGGFAVIGITQHLPGYCLLLTDDPAANHLSDLDRARRTHFLLDMSLLGEAVERVCRPDGLRRINYEVLGNSAAFLHAHVHARYEWEPAEYARGPVWRYPAEVRDAAEHRLNEERHGPLRAAIAEALRSITDDAYGAGLRQPGGSR